MITNVMAVLFTIFTGSFHMILNLMNADNGGRNWLNAKERKHLLPVTYEANVNYFSNT